MFNVVFITFQAGPLTPVEKELLLKSQVIIHETDFKSLVDLPAQHVVRKTFVNEIELLNSWAKKVDDDPSKVIPDHLVSMLNGPLTIPRNHNWDMMHQQNQNKDPIAAYIWQKLGMYSTLNCLQRFYAQQFLQAVRSSYM
jgi:hypothetical protein